MPRASIGNATLSEILAFLNQEEVRATYGAVAEVLGVAPRALGAQLGPRTPEASWIVSAANGLPTGYSQNEIHPALLSNSAIITSGIELLMRLSTFKGKGEAEGG